MNMDEHLVRRVNDIIHTQKEESEKESLLPRIAKEPNIWWNKILICLCERKSMSASEAMSFKFHGVSIVLRLVSLTNNKILKSSQMTLFL